jgi:RHS repeat-associated protein
MYNAKGEKTWEADLDIYGKVRTFAGRSLSECPFRYQGQYEDSETGLYYNRFRYYSPEEGMYLSKDPIGLAGGLNTYAYVSDSNILLDIWGLMEQGRDKFGKFLSKNPGDSVPGTDAVSKVLADYQADPRYAVLGQEISFTDGHQTRRYDIVVHDLNTNEIVGIEVKSQPSTYYGGDQKTFDKKVKPGSNIVPTGDKAKQAGITRIDRVDVIKGH